MNGNTGALTWCRRCQDFLPCEVVVSSDNGIYKSTDTGYRLRDRFCKKCNSHFTTYEVDAAYLRNLKWEYRMAKKELEYAKLSREKIQELVKNLMDYYKEDDEFWKERESLLSEEESSIVKERMNVQPRLFPTKAELEAMKLAREAGSVNEGSKNQTKKTGPRLFPTKAELEAMKAAIKGLQDSKNEMEPHLRLVENDDDTRIDD